MEQNLHSFYTIDYEDKKVKMINQLLLPGEVVYEQYSTYEEVAKSIVDMVIRGAPAIGITAAYGIAQAFVNKQDESDIDTYFEKVKKTFAETRPTAVNLFWSIEKMEKLFNEVKTKSVEEISEVLLKEAIRIHEDDIKICQSIGENGAELIKDDSTILTHCNAGALATGAWGTALGVIRSAAKTKKIKVLCCETRPYLQGARLTAWELMSDGIDTTLITDNMAAHYISKGMIDAIVVGADRVAANGDAANKIGTLSHSINANYYDVPMYFAVPKSTIDPKTPTGKEIPIEERSEREVTYVKDSRIAPDNVKVLNPAFDVTPNELVSAIITEDGIFKGPYDFNKPINYIDIK
jgi:methylthioribose-1-phosphate isomerase